MLPATAMPRRGLQPEPQRLTVAMVARFRSALRLRMPAELESGSAPTVEAAASVLQVAQDTVSESEPHPLFLFGLSLLLIFTDR